jgi:hypothetical protein
MQFGTLVDMTVEAPAHTPRVQRRARSLWPLPALATWAGAWALFQLLANAGAPAWLAIAAGVALGLVCSVMGATRMRSWVVAGGFPLSLLASGAASGVPGWAWLLPLALLACVYPLNAWRDAPLFPTPPRALDGLARLAPLPAGARVLDAGCGLGQGLVALRRAYPTARIEGVEWSWPLAALTRLRHRWASVAQGDMWAADWRGLTLVYLFQRPESMARALDKASRELPPGAWLASLEFEADGWLPQATHRCPDGRPVWLYRMPATRRGEAG